MERRINRRLGRRLSQLNREHRHKKWWQQVVSFLAILVVFCTTYSLIMNAITLELSPDPDPDRFTVNGAETTGEFRWANPEAGLSISATLHGNASYVGTLPEHATLQLQPDFDGVETLEWLENYSGEEAVFPLLAFRLRLYAIDAETGEGIELLLDRCDADITCTLKRELFSSAAMAIADDLSEDPFVQEPPMSLVAVNQKTELAAADLTEQSDPVLTFTARADDTNAVVVEANPAYTLQHYLWFPSVVTTVPLTAEERAEKNKTQKYIPFINTSYGNPRGEVNAHNRPSLDMLTHLQGLVDATALESRNRLFYAYLQSDGTLETKLVLERLFMDETTSYRVKPQISYMNRLYNGLEDYNDHYTLAEIWVYTPQDGTAAPVDSITKTDFVVYQVPANGDRHLPERIRFTNNPNNRHLHETGGATTAYPYDKTIYIANNSIVRLVFEYTTEDGVERGANFFDYDITDGYIYQTADDAKNQTNRIPTSQQATSAGIWYAHTQQSGINHPDNYEPGSGLTTRFSMGGANTGTGLERSFVNGQWINQRNRLDATYGNPDLAYNGCSFGLIQGLSYGAQGLPIPQWAANINAPDLFSKAAANGKTVYENYALGFARQGGTYTLNYVKNTNTGNQVTGDLRTLVNPQTKYPNIFTNHFWPMDDPDSASYGTDGHDLKFGDESKKNNRIYATNSAFPVSDAGNVDHNGYFGMSFTVDFTLEPGYCGPLAYWFYGDDDMWVFLDELDADGNSVPGKSKLVADIGGVHGATGEYVNLWEYTEPTALNATSDVTYRLTIFYTERGASGSTCFMRFTVPLKANDTEPPQRDEALMVEKIETGANGEKVPYDANGTLYEFRMKMVTAEGVDYEDIYEYTIYRRDLVFNHQTVDQAIGTGPPWPEGVVDRGTIGHLLAENGEYVFYLRNGEYIVISNLPDDTYYTIREVRPDDRQFVTQYQKGQHRHAEDGTPIDALDPAIRYSFTAGAAERINSSEYNYVVFTNGQLLKTEVLPGDGESVHIGQEIVYDIEWTNDTTVEANVIVTDPLDAGVDFLGAKFGTGKDASASDWWDATGGDYVSADGTLRISYNPKTHTVTWTLTGRRNDSYGLVSLKVRVNDKSIEKETVPGKFGTLNPRVENQATVQIGDASIRTNVVENPVWGPFKVEQSPGEKAPVVAGDKIVYTITWRNYQKAMATVTVRDPLDPSVSYVPDSAKAYLGAYGDASAVEISATVVYDEQKRELRWNLGEHPPDAEGYVMFEVTVNAKAASDVIWNQGFVQVGNAAELESNRVSNPIYGYRLPETGGHGSAGYVVIGLLLMLCAGAMWLCSRKGRGRYENSS